MDNLMEEQLREYYATLQRVDSGSRESLLEKLDESSVVSSQNRLSLSGNFVLKASIAAATCFAAAVLITIAVFSNTASSVAWAEVVKRLPVIETMQHRRLDKIPPRWGRKQETWNYSVGYRAKDCWRTDGWEIADESSIPAADARPDNMHIIITDPKKRETTAHNWNYKEQRFIRNTGYRSINLAAKQSRDPAKSMESLKDLPPESVRQKGRTEKLGREVVVFETVPEARVYIPGILHYGELVSIFVDVQSKLPIAIESKSREDGLDLDRFFRVWDISLNQTPSSVFDVPVLPADADGEELWTFSLPSRLWKEKDAFTFRVIAPDGKPIITEADFRLEGPYRAGGYGSVFLAEGHKKLNRFMARNVGEIVTIEIAGEPPIQRKIFGRLSGNSAVELEAVDPGMEPWVERGATGESQ